jgi:hypothetical protein
VGNWAEVRRLHRADGVSIKEVGRRFGVARNTVRAALASGSATGVWAFSRESVVDAFELPIRVC